MREFCYFLGLSDDDIAAILKESDEEYLDDDTLDLSFPSSPVTCQEIDISCYAASSEPGQTLTSPKRRKRQIVCGECIPSWSLFANVV